MRLRLGLVLLVKPTLAAPRSAGFPYFPLPWLNARLMPRVGAKIAKHGRRFRFPFPIDPIEREAETDQRDGFAGDGEVGQAKPSGKYRAIFLRSARFMRIPIAIHMHKWGHPFVQSPMPKLTVRRGQTYDLHLRPRIADDDVSAHEGQANRMTGAMQPS
jgi:hypothetical protein